MNSQFLKLSTTIVAAMVFSMTASADNPAKHADNAWISVSGTVKSVSDDSFKLDHGKGMITVEMDTGDRHADSYKLKRGDIVTVAGMIDKSFYDETTLNARSLYVKDVDTYFYSSLANDSDAVIASAQPRPPANTWLQGKVNSVSEAQDHFVVNTATQPITVEVHDMRYNPLDEKGYQKVELGDVVRVYGEMEPDALEGRVFNASFVTTVVDQSRQY